MILVVLLVRGVTFFKMAHVHRVMFRVHAISVLPSIILNAPSVRSVTTYKTPVCPAMLLVSIALAIISVLNVLMVTLCPHCLEYQPVSASLVILMPTVRPVSYLMLNVHHV